MLGMAERIFKRLTPDPTRLAELEQVRDDDSLAEYVGYVVERLISEPDLARALIELRLEAARSPEVDHLLAPFLRQGLDADVAFHTSRGLSGGRPLVLLLHHVVNGIMLDHLTTPLDPSADPVAAAKGAARRMASPAGSSDPAV